jgi:formiminoglutamase
LALEQTAETRAASAWNCYQSIANIQHNRFAKEAVLLFRSDNSRGNESENLDFNDIDDRSKLSKIVEKIDKDVSHGCSIIQWKSPIIIGGGHNNSRKYKGTAL